ncbi:MAG: hypothetical protein M0D53_12770 [Flavobacterium sp. JAD_PAG50586_2]|nr:MAG: hypothetical protein M0D53_12770 [Flavobacterium sp. JAD_PAG50586_2]
MKTIFLLLACCLISCQQQSNKKSVTPDVPNPETPSDTKIQYVSEKYPVGDINHDNVKDTATVSFDFNYNTQEVICPTPNCAININFSLGIPDLDIDQSLGIFVKPAPDLNNDNGNDILLFSRTNEGSWNDIFAYTLSNGKWIELARTKCFFSDDADAEHRIVKEKNQYFLVGDSWDDSKGGVVARSVKVKMEPTASVNWLESFDLDGDGKSDKIYFDYTKGAHCCYKINITLSSDGKVRKFPFEMDGGYIADVDDSQPEQFSIGNIDKDALPEITMRIQTYNGEASPIPSAWKKQYGITGNKIVLEYVGKEIRVRDY